MEQNLISIGRHFVPSVWQRMLPEDFFHLDYPDEKESNCHNCPQVVRADFKMPYKCCTYIPRIPNFLIGAALVDPGAGPGLFQGVAKFGLPDGIMITPGQYADSLLENARGRFGRTDLIRCPFLNPATAGCGIYPYRNSVCSTFFCRNSHGTRGQVVIDGHGLAAVVRYDRKPGAASGATVGVGRGHIHSK